MGFNCSYRYSSEWKCEPCVAEEKTKEEARRIQYEAAAEKSRQLAHERREKSKEKAAAKYGSRLIKNCPSCDSGVLFLRINGTSLSMFLGCSNYTSGCHYVEPIPKDKVKEYRETFLGDLCGSWAQDEYTPEGFVEYFMTVLSPKRTYPELAQLMEVPQ
jgi:hypothetical protein